MGDAAGRALFRAEGESYLRPGSVLTRVENLFEVDVAVHTEGTDIADPVMHRRQADEQAGFVLHERLFAFGVIHRISAESQCGRRNAVVPASPLGHCDVEAEAGVHDAIVVPGADSHVLLDAEDGVRMDVDAAPGLQPLFGAKVDQIEARWLARRVDNETK